MILSVRYGDPYGRPGDWCRIRGTPGIIRESWHVCLNCLKNNDGRRMEFLSLADTDANLFLDGYHKFKVVPWFNARLSARWVPGKGFRPWKAKGSRDQYASGNVVAFCQSHFQNHHSLITTGAPNEDIVQNHLI